jgi:isocitrate/isopropylmalate dehydrogenase
MAWTSYAVSMSSTLALSDIPGVPDHISLWGLLIPIRRAFQRYVNLRPVRLLPASDSALKNFPPGQIDMCIVRENMANPIAQIRSRAMMLQPLGQRKAARGVEKAFEAELARRDAQTPDLGSKASTRDVGDAVRQEISVVAEPQ